MNAIVVRRLRRAASTSPCESPTSAVAVTVHAGSPSDRRRTDAQLHDVRGAARDERGGPDGLEQLLAVELGAAWRGRRQDLLVVRELAVDQPADEVDALDVEQHLVARLGEHELDRVVGIGEHAHELGEGPRRDRPPRRSSTGSRIVDRPHGDPVVVGRGERQPVALEPG